MTNKAFLKLDGRDIAHTALVCRALSSEIRLTILQQLVKGAIAITALASAQNVPPSTMSSHLRLLEQAGLITITPLPGSRGSKKICSSLVKCVEVNIINQLPDTQFSGCLFCRDMPVGNYFDFAVSAPCGLASSDGFLSADDDPYGFALPSHVDAQILWLTTGYLEYHFGIKNEGVDPHLITRVEFSLEICAETYGYNENWRSEVDVYANGLPLGKLICLGGHGGRPGRFNPSWWPAYATQFGDLHRIVLDENGVSIDGIRSIVFNIRDILQKDSACIRLKLGVDKQSQYAGGFNLFGSSFGNHKQGILMQVYGKENE